MNLKLVCRDFYFAIEENIQLLDRPNVTCIRICYTKNKLSAADFDLKSTKNTMKGGTLKHVEFSNDFEYENFLKNKDFNEVRNLYLHNRESGTNILVCNSSFFIRSFPMNVFTVSLLNDESSSLPLLLQFRAPVNLKYHIIIF
uniref:F-box domain-containing protein n=1 Tax=Strongyloides venezuelensis TaxID=75913 RepID=A0A0K0G472_STRVS